MLLNSSTSPPVEIRCSIHVPVALPAMQLLSCQLPYTTF